MTRLGGLSNHLKAGPADGEASRLSAMFSSVLLRLLGPAFCWLANRQGPEKYSLDLMREATGETRLRLLLEHRHPTIRTRHVFEAQKAAQRRKTSFPKRRPPE